MLSRGRFLLLAVFCMTAVRKLMGLNRYDKQRLLGVIMSLVQSSSCALRSNMSLYQFSRLFRLGYANFYQAAGTLLNCNDCCSVSMASVMLRAPVSPSCRSYKECLMASRRILMR